MFYLQIFMLNKKYYILLTYSLYHNNVLSHINIICEKHDTQKPNITISNPILQIIFIKMTFRAHRLALEHVPDIYL